MGIFDPIVAALSDKKPAANDGHTTSGLDAAMQAHADKLHPVNSSGAGVQQKDSGPGKITRNKDGSLHFPFDGD